LKSQNFPFRVLTFGIILILILPALLKDGMFMDGLQYACVSKNLAHGQGTFWQPHLSNTWNKEGNHAFLEHPPLVFGIQSLFFRALGDSRYTERIYSFLTALITAWLIAMIWRFVFRKEEKIRNSEWFPVLLWIITPVCFWSYRNNMQENTMGIFTLAAVYFSLRAVEKSRRYLPNLLLAGIFTVAAVLSKGLPGLFPLAFIPVYKALHKDFTLRKMLLYWLIFLAIVAAGFSLILLIPGASESLRFWLFERVFSRIESEVTTSNRFDVIWRIFTELIPALLIAGGLILTGKFRKYNPGNNYRKQALLFIIMGLAGSLPMLFTLVQKGFYLVPVFPLFTLGLAAISVPFMVHFTEKSDPASGSFRAFRLITLVFLAGILVFSAMQINKTCRDEEVLSDVYRLGSVIPEHSTAGINRTLYANWPLQLYLLRYYDINVDPSPVESPDYFILEKKDTLPAAAGYRREPLNTLKFDLYRLSAAGSR